MPDSPVLLKTIFEGWDGYQTSILHAIEPLKPEQLAWRPAPGLSSVGETVGHIALGRIGWFANMDAPGSRELAARATAVQITGGNLDPRRANDLDLLVDWLNQSWSMVEATLAQWQVADLLKTYQHPYIGKVYQVSYQWTIWRIMTHDIHHGGQLALMLGAQGLPVVELGDLGGHLTEPPVIAG